MFARKMFATVVNFSHICKKNMTLGGVLIRSIHEKVSSRKISLESALNTFNDQVDSLKPLLPGDRFY